MPHSQFKNLPDVTKNTVVILKIPQVYLEAETKNKYRIPTGTIGLVIDFNTKTKEGIVIFEGRNFTVRFPVTPEDHHIEWYIVVSTHEEALKRGGLEESELERVDQNGNSFSNIQMPAVRKVFPPMTAQSIVSVQPMSLPTGLLFYTEQKYGTTTKQANAKSRHNTKRNVIRNLATHQAKAWSPKGFKK